GLHPDDTFEHMANISDSAAQSIEDVEPAIWRALATITDPEMPVSLVDMGMVYRVAVADGTAEIDLTFTSSGCPAMDMILDDVRQAVGALPGIERVEIEVVWSPPWTKERLTQKGRTLLLASGLAL
ncbi:MAG: metal-sulfur cluster assembly factor, partial [Gemmatimonadota bacterium]